MASKTTNYGLNKHSPQDFYNVEARNENWDKIDEALAATDPTKVTTKATLADGDGVMIADSADGGKAKRLLWSNVKAALGKLFVPLARKINGKALTKDVTLTGDDIAMGADDAESLRAAMAKRLKGEAFLFDGIDLNTATISGMYRCSHNNPNIPSSDYGQLLVVHGGADTIAQIYFPYNHTAAFVRTGSPPEINGTTQWGDWEQLAVCTAPEVHELPLASGLTAFAHTFCNYSKTQENIVHLTVWITGPLSSNQVIGTLPEGFRPVTNYSCAAYCSYATSGNIDTRYPVKIVIQYDGLIYCYSSILDGSQFELGFAVSFVVRD